MSLTPSQLSFSLSTNKFIILIPDDGEGKEYRDTPYWLHNNVADRPNIPDNNLKLFLHYALGTPEEIIKHCA